MEPALTTSAKTAIELLDKCFEDKSYVTAVKLLGALKDSIPASTYGEYFLRANAGIDANRPISGSVRAVIEAIDDCIAQNAWGLAYQMLKIVEETIPKALYKSYSDRMMEKAGLKNAA